MHATRTPLQVWFWGAYLVTTQTPGMSALQFQRQLGLSRYETAFQLLHKLRSGMVRPDRDRIGALWPIEVDEVLIGGKTRGEGRGVHHKGVCRGCRGGSSEARSARSSRRLRWTTAPAGLEGSQQKSLETFVTENIEPHTRLITDGWLGYANLASMGYDHQSIVLGVDPQKVEKALPIIHLVLSNLKAWLLGTHHGVSEQHLATYLNEFVFRFNRRFYPMTEFASVLGIGTQVTGQTYDALYAEHRHHASANEQPETLHIVSLGVKRIGML